MGKPVTYEGACAALLTPSHPGDRGSLRCQGPPQETLARQGVRAPKLKFCGHTLLNVLFSLLTPDVRFCPQEASAVACAVPGGGRTLPTSEVKPLEGPSGKSRDPPREEEKERKRKKHKKRSRTRSRSPKSHSSSKSRSRSHPKAKHCLPSAYRTARRSRWVHVHPYARRACACARACEHVSGGVRACDAPFRPKRQLFKVYFMFYSPL